MLRRRPAARGLSYWDANKNRLITETGAVSDVKREIEATWPDRFEVYFDTWQEEWVIAQHCDDGIDRFYLATKALNQSIIDKIHREDPSKHPQEDLDRKIQLEEDDLERKKDHDLTEATGDAAERLFWALRKDAILHIPKAFIPESIPS